MQPLLPYFLLYFTAMLLFIIQFPLCVYIIQSPPSTSKAALCVLFKNHSYLGSYSISKQCFWLSFSIHSGVHTLLLLPTCL